MLKSLGLGAVLGGLTAFLWSFISWSFLPWHLKQYHPFQNEDEVAAVISSHAPESGIYLLPMGPSQEGMNAEQKKPPWRFVRGKCKKVRSCSLPFNARASARFPAS